MIFNPCATPGSQIAAQANLDRDLPLRQQLNDPRILNRRQSVPDSLGMKQIHSRSDRLRPCALARHARSDAVRDLSRKHTARSNHSAGPRTSSPPIPTPTTLRSRYCTAFSKTRCAASAPKWRTASKIQSSDTPKSLCTALASALQAFEDRIEFLPAPVNHADRNIDFRMLHILRRQFLHQPIGDQLIVFRRAQPLADGLERHQESNEIFVLIELANFRFSQFLAALGIEAVLIAIAGERDIVPPAQLNQRRRIDRSFEMQVQLSFRKRFDEGEIGHRSISPHRDAQEVFLRVPVSSVVSWSSRTRYAACCRTRKLPAPAATSRRSGST